MKSLKNFACLTFLFAIALSLVCGMAYGQAPDNYLKMKGKILDGHTADITVFQEVNGDWSPVRTMKSRKNYFSAFPKFWPILEAVELLKHNEINVVWRE